MFIYNEGHVKFISRNGSISDDGTGYSDDSISSEEDEPIKKKSKKNSKSAAKRSAASVVDTLPPQLPEKAVVEPEKDYSSGSYNTVAQ